MLKNLILCLVISLFAGKAYAQNLEWINKHARPLAADTLLSKNEDLSFLTEVLKYNTVLGLGEASHGTHEFYIQKQRIIQYAVTRLGYKLIGFEASEEMVKPINQCLQGGKADLKKLMKNMGLYNAVEIYNLFQWITEYNKTQMPDQRVILFGFDDPSFWPDPYTRDQLMAEKIKEARNIKQAKTIVWSHNVHIAKDTTMAQFKAMGSYLKAEYQTQFYAIGFDTDSGTVNILNDGNFEKHDFTAHKKTFSDLFAQAAMERFFLPFNNIADAFPESRNEITNIYSNWTEKRSLPIKPGVDFDAIIFIRTTSPSAQLH